MCDPSGSFRCGSPTTILILPVSVIWSRRQSIIAANALYQIEVNHVDQVVFDAKMVRELLG